MERCLFGFVFFFNLFFNIIFMSRFSIHLYLIAFCHTLDIVGKPSMRRHAQQASWFHNVSTCIEEVIEY
jgi:hypothetical protein